MFLGKALHAFRERAVKTNRSTGQRRRRRGQAKKRDDQYFIHALGMDGEVLDDRAQCQGREKI